MGRVGRALVWVEFSERARDRWVLLISALFAILAWGIGLYGKSAEEAAAQLTGASLVTLVGLLVPLVALLLGYDAIVGERERHTLALLLSLPVARFEVIIAKFLGRLLALGLALCLGLGGALLFADASYLPVLLRLLGPAFLLGATFLAVGVLISSVAQRLNTAAALMLCFWFLFVFFYDLGLLGLLVISDGALSSATISSLVMANPAGLFRIQMTALYADPQFMANMGLASVAGGSLEFQFIWTVWIVVPLVLSTVILSLQKAAR